MIKYFCDKCDKETKEYEMDGDNVSNIICRACLPSSKKKVKNNKT